MIYKVKVFESDLEWLKQMASELGLSEYDIVEIVIEHWKKTKGETSLSFFG